MNLGSCILPCPISHTPISGGYAFTWLCILWNVFKTVPCCQEFRRNWPPWIIGTNADVAWLIAPPTSLNVSICIAFIVRVLEMQFQFWQVCSFVGLCVCLSVCLSVCQLSTRYRPHRLSNQHQTWHKYGTCLRDELYTFWCWWRHRWRHQFKK